MTVTLYTLLGLLLVLYAIGFLYETSMSFVRLGNTKREVYPHASWEVIHTTLVLAFACFMITHGQMLPEIAPLILVPFMIALLGFFLRATFQLLIFFGRKDSKKRNWVDWGFALCHIAILVPFLYAVTTVIIYLATHPLDVLTDMFSWFIPGLLVGIAINLVPIVYIFRHQQY